MNKIGQGTAQLKKESVMRANYKMTKAEKAYAQELLLKEYAYMQEEKRIRVSRRIGLTQDGMVYLLVNTERD
jgi:hypothetical protein